MDVSAPVNAPLIAAGSLALIGAAVHGVGGEVLVVGKLAPAMLPPSRFGGPRATKTMLHATWHMTTVAFLTVGGALIVAGSALHGATGPAIALLAPRAVTGFAAVAGGVGATAPAGLRPPRPLLLPPAPP